jgi:hypothetical protein
MEVSCFPEHNTVAHSTTPVKEGGKLGRVPNLAQLDIMGLRAGDVPTIWDIRQVPQIPALSGKRHSMLEVTCTWPKVML